MGLLKGIFGKKGSSRRKSSDALAVPGAVALGDSKTKNEAVKKDAQSQESAVRQPPAPPIEAVEASLLEKQQQDSREQLQKTENALDKETTTAVVVPSDSGKGEASQIPTAPGSPAPAPVSAPASAPLDTKFEDVDPIAPQPALTLPDTLLSSAEKEEVPAYEAEDPPCEAALQASEMGPSASTTPRDEVEPAQGAAVTPAPVADAPADETTVPEATPGAAPEATTDAVADAAEDAQVPAAEVGETAMEAATAEAKADVSLEATVEPVVEATEKPETMEEAEVKAEAEAEAEVGAAAVAEGAASAPSLAAGMSGGGSAEACDEAAGHGEASDSSGAGGDGVEGGGLGDGDGAQVESAAGGESGDGVLPPGWVAVTLEDGRVYYWNQDVDETTWERPVYAARAPESACTSASESACGSAVGSVHLLSSAPPQLIGLGSAVSSSAFSVASANETEGMPPFTPTKSTSSIRGEFERKAHDETEAPRSKKTSQHAKAMAALERKAEKSEQADRAVGSQRAHAMKGLEAARSRTSINSGASQHELAMRSLKGKLHSDGSKSPPMSPAPAPFEAMTVKPPQGGQFNEAKAALFQKANQAVSSPQRSQKEEAMRKLNAKGVVPTKQAFQVQAKKDSQMSQAMSAFSQLDGANVAVGGPKKSDLVAKPSPAQRKTDANSQRAAAVAALQGKINPAEAE